MQPKEKVSSEGRQHEHFQLTYEVDEAKVEKMYEAEYVRSYNLLLIEQYKKRWKQYALVLNKV